MGVYYTDKYKKRTIQNRDLELVQQKAAVQYQSPNQIVFMTKRGQQKTTK